MADDRVRDGVDATGARSDGSGAPRAADGTRADATLAPSDGSVAHRAADGGPRADASLGGRRRVAGPRRPVSAVFASLVLALIAIGGIAYGILLIALASLAVASTAVVVAGVTCVTYGAAAVYAAIDVWRGRSAGWWTGVLLSAMGLGAVAIAALSSSWHPTLLLALALCGWAMTLLLLPATRHHARG